MTYKKVKVYFDGSHYIGIPHISQPWKRRKIKPVIKNVEQVKKVKEIYKSVKGNKKEKIEKAISIINDEIKDIEESKSLVNETIEKEKRNKIVRLTRLYRKANLQQWNYFCTFTYDSNKLSEEEFRVRFLNCIRHLSNRKDWKYIGVFERSPVLQRLHFHGIFLIPTMIGSIQEIKDYSTKTHKMQIAHQNTFFIARFGRNDFRKIENPLLIQQSIRYILKYIQKTGEKVIYSKHLQTYFITDIVDEDVVCRIGQEDRKLLLFDDFKCYDLETGEVFGTVCPETISKLEKTN